MPFDTPEKRSELFAQLGNQRWKDFENGSPEYLPSFPETPAEEVPEGLAPVSAEFYSYYVPDAIHIDLYDRLDKIPFDKLESFFKEAFEK